MAAADEHAGAVQMEGCMVDRPVLLRAQAFMDRARHCPSPDLGFD